MYLTNLPNLSATERVTICTQFKYGCCEVEEAIIPAQGPNQSGCPSACKCHVLGKFFSPYNASNPLRLPRIQETNCRPLLNYSGRCYSTKEIESFSTLVFC